MTNTARWVLYGALFLIPFIPLYVANGMFFPFITGKGFAFRILVEIAVVAWGVLVLFDKTYRPRSSWVLWLYGGLVLWMFVADLFAVNPHKSFWSNYERMDGWVTLVHMFLLFLVSASFLTVQKKWQAWWMTFLAGSALVCGYGLLQIMGVLQTHQGERIDASFGNAAYLPAYLLFGIAIALWQAVLHKGTLRYALILLSVAQAFILLFTATRGALFGLVGAVVFSALLYAWQSPKGRKVAYGVLTTVLVLGTFFFLIKDSALVKESQTLSRLSSVFSLSQELGVRAQIWTIGLEGFLDEPVTGYGHEGFIYPFNTHYKPALFAQEQWFDRAHNIYLDWLIAGGAPALLLFLALMLYATWMLFRKEFPLAERIAISGAFVAYAIQGIVVFDNLFTYVPLAMLLAYIHAKIAVPLPQLEQAPTLPRASVPIVAAAVIAVGAGLVYVVNVPGIVGSSALIRSFSESDPYKVISALQSSIQSGTFATQEVREQMIMRLTNVATQQGVPAEIKQAFASLALSEMQKEVAMAPKDARLRLQYATGFRAIGDATSALKEIDTALALSPNKQMIFIEQGGTLMQAGSLLEARDAFKKAYQLDPSFKVPAAYLAAGDILIGQIEEAEALLDEHYDDALTDVPEVVLGALQQKGYVDTIVTVLRARARNAGNTPEARLQVVSYLAGAKEFDRARSEVSAIVRDNPALASSAKDWLAQIDALQQQP